MKPLKLTVCVVAAVFSMAHPALRAAPAGMDNAVATTATTRAAAPGSALVGLARDWMARLPDTRSLAQISIPGTHDSAAAKGGRWVQTQSWDLAEQLDAGIRYLDIRVKPLKAGKTGSFAVQHGEVPLDIGFSEVLAKVHAFLRKSPGETVLMRVKQCCKGQKGAPGFATIWAGYQKRYPNLFAGKLDHLPTLAEVRDKVVVLRDANFGRHAVGMPYADSQWTAIQDKYTLTTDADLDDKLKRVRTRLDKAQDDARLTLNHASGTGAKAPDVKLDLDGLHRLATDVRGIIKNTPWEVAQRTNPVAMDRIKQTGGPRHFGVLIMDFPGEAIIARLINSNFDAPLTRRR